MKTKRMIRASFSDKTLNLTLPDSWEKLTQEELMQVYKVMSASKDDDVRVQIFFALAGLRVVRSDGDGFICAVKTAERELTFRVDPLDISGHLDCMDFIFTPGSAPVRPDLLNGCEATNSHFHGVSFVDYLTLENYYQGYLQTKEPRSVLGMLHIMYKPWSNTDIKPEYELAVVNWFAQVKNMFAETFSDFFRPVSAESDTQPNMMEVMDAQIRALTGGDVTKEQVVLGTDCWRALTELNAKAREADELRRKYSTK